LLLSLFFDDERLFIAVELVKVVTLRHVEAAGSSVSLGGSTQHLDGVFSCHDEQVQLQGQYRCEGITFLNALVKATTH